MLELNPQSVNNHYRFKHPKMHPDQKSRIMRNIFGTNPGNKEPALSHRERALMRITGVK